MTIAAAMVSAGVQVCAGQTPQNSQGQGPAATQPSMLDRLNQIQRYSGAESHVPRLDRPGGTSWARTTARVKKDIAAYAKIQKHAVRARQAVEMTGDLG